MHSTPRVPKEVSEITSDYLAIFFSVNCYQEVIHILQESDLWVCPPVFPEVLMQGFAKDSWGVFEIFGELGPNQLYIVSWHSKANKDWLFGAKGRLKRSSLRSNTVYQACMGGSEHKRVYEFGHGGVNVHNPGIDLFKVVYGLVIIWVCLFNKEQWGIPGWPARNQNS